MRIRFAVGLFGFVAVAHGQGIAKIVVGSEYVDNQPALQSRLSIVQGLAISPGGDFFLAENGRILRLHGTPGLLTAVTGGGKNSNTNDGPALSVNATARKLAIEKNGNIVFLGNGTIRRLDFATGTIVTLAGRHASNDSIGDGGPASQAVLNSPQDLALDSAGNIYIVENGGNRVRRIDSKTGVITTVAGAGTRDFTGDGGPATAATLGSPQAICFDSHDNMYISDDTGTRIRKVSAATGTITTIAGTGSSLMSGDGGPLLQAAFINAYRLQMDAGDNLYIADQNRVRRVSSASGFITTIAGTGNPGITGDGVPATEAQLNPPQALAVDAAGNTYIPDGVRVRVVSAARGLISTVAGTSGNGDGGTAREAIFFYPNTLAFNAAGDLYIGDNGATIRKVDHVTGLISTLPVSIAGVHLFGFFTLSFHSMSVDPAGNILVGTTGAILRIDPTGAASVLAGKGTPGFSGDRGPAISAQLGWVSAMKYDAAGNLLFAESDNLRVRRIDAHSGVITTVAGNGKTGYSGDGTTAVSASIGGAIDIAVDRNGNIYITGSGGRLLKVTPDGVITAAAGNGRCGYTGDGGDPRLAEVCPTLVAIDPAGNIFTAEAACQCVRRIAADTGIIQTVAGSKTFAEPNDGVLATNAYFRTINAMTFYGGSLYLADGPNTIAWSVTPPVPPPLDTAKPAFSQVVSPVDLECTSITPGELVTILGNYLGPPEPGFLTIGADGRVTTQLSGVQVFFDDIAAPLVYVSAGQIYAFVPWGVKSTNPSAAVRIASGGDTVPAGPISSRAVRIFLTPILNADGTLNGASNPAPKGSAVTMFGSGFGQTNPPSVDGAITPFTNIPTLTEPFPPVSLSANPAFQGVAAEVLYAGPAPGLVNGISELKVQIPLSAATGSNTVQILTACVAPTVFVQ